MTQELVDMYPYLKVERRQFKDLMKQLLALDPAKRISLGDALKHQFFDEFYEEEHAYIFEKISKYFQRRENIFK
jgi:serine/threonine protein kinase